MEELTIGSHTVLYDHSDVPLVNQYHWGIDSSTGYVCTYTYDRGARSKLYMHRLIMGVKDSSEYVDHINHNRLDNTRKNLRIGTSAHNQRNRRILQPNIQSRMRSDGVIMHYPRITRNYRIIPLGSCRSYWAAELLWKINNERLLHDLSIVAIKLDRKTKRRHRVYL